VFGRKIRKDVDTLIRRSELCPLCFSRVTGHDREAFGEHEEWTYSGLINSVVDASKITTHFECGSRRIVRSWHDDEGKTQTSTEFIAACLRIEGNA
jgi:hypothetical protein